MTTKDGSSQNRIYVGNLPFSMTEAELMKVFAEHGAVLHTMVAVNKESGKSRGFGFVTFTTKIDADALIAAGTLSLDDGRALVIKPALPKVAKQTAQPSRPMASKTVDWSKIW